MIKISTNSRISDDLLRDLFDAASEAGWGEDYTINVYAGYFVATRCAGAQRRKIKGGKSVAKVAITS